MSHKIKSYSKSPLTIIDSSLNPDNALEKGYRYINDIPNLYQSLLELLEYAEKQGYKLGTAEGVDGERHLGLYCKTDNRSDTKTGND